MARRDLSMSGAESTRGGAEEGMGLIKAAVLLFSLLSVLLVLALGADRLLRTDNFPVRNVRFEGEFKHVTQQELQSAVMNAVHGNFFLINLDTVKARVESLPWVYKASVRRQWPQDVYVRFTEQQLAARWGDAAFLNQAGDIVRVPGDEQSATLPRLEGPDGTGPQVLENYKNFGQILAAAGLKLERITLTPRRTWRLMVTGADHAPPAASHAASRYRTGGGTPGVAMVIVIDHEQPGYKLERFARVYARTLAPQAMDIRQVDLRYTNGFAVEQASGPTADLVNTLERVSSVRSGHIGVKG
jgi:cell division protein FtsQ